MKGGKMQINFYNCNAERNRVDKGSYLTGRFPMDGALREEASVTNPIILVEKTNPALSNYNYMYIPDFNRWYFIDDFVSVRNGLWEVHGKVDVLYSFINDIKSSEGVLDKYEDTNRANLYLDDGSFITDCRKDNQVIEFNNGFNEDGEYILICAGGV